MTQTIIPFQTISNLPPQYLNGVEVFTFEELDSDRQELSLAAWVEYQSSNSFDLIDSDYYQSEYYPSKGIHLSNIFYSISWSQSDYCKFLIDTIDTDKVIEEIEEFKKYKRIKWIITECCDFSINTNHNRDCSIVEPINFKSFNPDWIEHKHNREYDSVWIDSDYRFFYPELTRINKAIENFFDDLNDWLYSEQQELYDILKSDLEYQYSEECFIEWIHDMDQFFDEEGNWL